MLIEVSICEWRRNNFVIIQKCCYSRVAMVPHYGLWFNLQFWQLTILYHLAVRRTCTYSPKGVTNVVICAIFEAYETIIHIHEYLPQKILMHFQAVTASSHWTQMHNSNIYTTSSTFNFYSLTYYLGICIEDALWARPQDYWTLFSLIKR